MCLINKLNSFLTFFSLIVKIVKLNVYFWSNPQLILELHLKYYSIKYSIKTKQKWNIEKFLIIQP